MRKCNYPRLYIYIHTYTQTHSHCHRPPRPGQVGAEGGYGLISIQRSRRPPPTIVWARRTYDEIITHHRRAEYIQSTSTFKRKYILRSTVFRREKYHFRVRDGPHTRTFLLRWRSVVPCKVIDSQGWVIRVGRSRLDDQGSEPVSGNDTHACWTVASG